MDIADHVRLDSHYADSLGSAEWVVCYGESLTRRTSPPPSGCRMVGLSEAEAQRALEDNIRHARHANAIDETLEPPCHGNANRNRDGEE